MDAIIQALARELGRSEAHIKNVVNLIERTGSSICAIWKPESRR